jgi:hypothetical protein
MYRPHSNPGTTHTLLSHATAAIYHGRHPTFVLLTDPELRTTLLTNMPGPAATGSTRRNLTWIRQLRTLTRRLDLIAAATHTLLHTPLTFLPAHTRTGTVGDTGVGVETLGELLTYYPNSDGTTHRATADTLIGQLIHLPNTTLEQIARSGPDTTHTALTLLYDHTPQPPDTDTIASYWGTATALTT